MSYTIKQLEEIVEGIVDEKLEQLIEGIDKEIMAFKLLGYTVTKTGGTFLIIQGNGKYYTVFYSNRNDKYKIHDNMGNAYLFGESTIEKFKKKLIDLL